MDEERIYIPLLRKSYHKDINEKWNGEKFHGNTYLNGNFLKKKSIKIWSLKYDLYKLKFRSIYGCTLVITEIYKNKSSMLFHFGF